MDSRAGPLTYSLYLNVLSLSVTTEDALARLLALLEERYDERITALEFEENLFELRKVTQTASAPKLPFAALKGRCRGYTARHLAVFSETLLSAVVSNLVGRSNTPAWLSAFRDLNNSLVLLDSKHFITQDEIILLLLVIMSPEELQSVDTLMANTMDVLRSGHAYKGALSTINFARYLLAEGLDSEATAGTASMIRNIGPDHIFSVVVTKASEDVVASLSDKERTAVAETILHIHNAIFYDPQIYELRHGARLTSAFARKLSSALHRLVNVPTPESASIIDRVVEQLVMRYRTGLESFVTAIHSLGHSVQNHILTASQTGSATLWLGSSASRQQAPASDESKCPLLIASTPQTTAAPHLGPDKAGGVPLLEQSLFLSTHQEHAPDDISHGLDIENILLTAEWEEVPLAMPECYMFNHKKGSFQTVPTRDAQASADASEPSAASKTHGGKAGARIDLSAIQAEALRRFREKVCK